MGIAPGGGLKALGELRISVRLSAGPRAGGSQSPLLGWPAEGDERPLAGAARGAHPASARPAPVPAPPEQQRRRARTAAATPGRTP